MQLVQFTFHTYNIYRAINSFSNISFTIAQPWPMTLTLWLDARISTNPFFHNISTCNRDEVHFLFLRMWPGLRLEPITFGTVEKMPNYDFSLLVIWEMDTEV